MQRDDWAPNRSRRVSALPRVMFDAETLSSTSAPGQRRLAAGRLGGPPVLADLHVGGEGRRAASLEQKVDAEGRDVARHFDLPADDARAGGEPAALVELAVARQVGLGRHAEELPGVEGRGAVEQPRLDPDRQAHHEHRPHPLRRVDQRGELGLHPIQQHRLLQEIVDRVARQAELGEDAHSHPRLVRSVHQLQRLRRVEAHVGRANPRRAGRHAHEAVRIGVGEGERASHAAQHTPPA